jgi:uroporphyrinogen-III decarboxylase
LTKVKYPELEKSSITEIFEIADKLREAEPHALMQLPDIQSPFDIAALIWNKEDFFTAMYDDPEAVKELVAMTEKLLVEFLDLWLERYGRDFTAHYPDYYMPYGVTLSEDEAGSLSPEMFREFSLDGLNRLSERYGIIGIHSCSNSYHQWENFKSIKNLKLLNIVQSEEICQKAYVYFRDICAQMHAVNVDSSIFNANKNMRVIIQDWAENIDIASKKSKDWKAWQENINS